jgi:aspartate racemase
VIAVATLALTAAALAQTPAPPAAVPPRWKTVGVIGGIGPQATMDFEERFHRAAQRRLPQRANGGYPPMVVLYHRRPPIVLDADGAPVMPVRLDVDLEASLEKLGPMVDFLVVTSNGAHLVQTHIEKAAGRPVLSMIDVTLEEVHRRRWKNVGVIGMGEPTVYTERLKGMGIAFETLPPARRNALDAVMLGVMAGQLDRGGRQQAEEAIAFLRQRRVDGVILGCSELPVVLGAKAEAPDLVNPVALLAEAAVERASR